MNRIIFIIIISFILIGSLSAQLLENSRNKKGEIILKNPSISNGILSFISETGGCTDKNSFKVRIEKDKKIGGFTHYRLTVERINPDYCKAFFPEGILIRFDLEKDLGLKGNYTVSIVNRIITGRKE